MRFPIIISVSIFSLLSSCSHSRNKETPKHETPKALEEKGSSFEILTKSRGDDLVASLYRELAEKTPDLKEFERKLENLSKSKSDSMKLFDIYDKKSQSFYTSAGEYSDQIKDSALKIKIKLLIKSSFTKYSNSVSQHAEILKSIEEKYLTLGDLHTILKITRTLPLIEEYQKSKLPSSKSILGFSKQLDSVIKYADTLTKK